MDESIIISSTVLAGQENIFRSCLRSFTTNLTGIQWQKSKIILNIDPTSKQEADADAFSAICNQYSGDCLVLPQTQANFPEALERVWYRAISCDAKYFLHMEGDWELMQPVSYQQLCKPLDRPEVYSTTLRYYSFTKPKLCLMPSVWQSDIAAQLMQDGFPRTINPEAELRERLRLLNFSRRRAKDTQLINVHWPPKPSQAVLRDLGTPFKRKNKLRGNGIGKGYTHIT